jgi:hypothetical protein
MGGEIGEQGGGKAETSNRYGKDKGVKESKKERGGERERERGLSIVLTDP